MNCTVHMLNTSRFSNRRWMGARAARSPADCLAPGWRERPRSWKGYPKLQVRGAAAAGPLGMLFTPTAALSPVSSGAQAPPDTPASAHVCQPAEWSGTS